MDASRSVRCNPDARLPCPTVRRGNYLEPPYPTAAAIVVLAYLNGQFLPRSSATISVEDRGFVFGDGVYEVWRVVNGRLFENERHLDRLAYGLRELRIQPPDVARIVAECAERLLLESGLGEGEATLYMEITRGVAPRTHQFPTSPTEPTVYATVNRFV